MIAFGIRNRCHGTDAVPFDPLDYRPEPLPPRPRPNPMAPTNADGLIILGGSMAILVLLASLLLMPYVLEAGSAALETVGL